MVALAEADTVAERALWRVADSAVPVSGVFHGNYSWEKHRTGERRAGKKGAL